MALNPLRIFLFLAGVVVAGLGVAYFSGSLDPLILGKPAEVASLPGQANGEANSKGERLPAPDKPATTAEPAEPAAKGDRLAPAFDVVRVEPDGSIVVAGHAEPKSKVEVLADGGNVVAAGMADGGGDFAIVFDDPLKPGDYQLTLRATPPQGEAVASAQTAIVSVPEKADGQVLAMVEEPGKPSQVITAPQPAVGEKPAQEAAGAQAPAPDKPQDVASADQSKPADAGTEAMKPATPAAEGTPAKPAAAGETNTAMDAGAEPKPAEPKGQDAAGQPAEVAKPAEPAGEIASAEPKPQVAGSADTGAAGPAAASVEAEKPADATPQPSETASAEPKADTPAEQAKPAPAMSSPSVSVQAVEIEGGKIFVAGNAEPGRTVRVYAGEELLGEARTAPNGRFLVEAEKDLAVGNYIIRADMLGDDGAQVVARAAVPFEREPGKSIAAVAPRPAQAGETPAAEKPAEMAAGETPSQPATNAPAADGKPASASGGGESAGTEPSVAGTEVGNGKPADIAAAQPAAPAQVDDTQLPKLGNDIAASPPEVLSAKLERSNDAVIIRRGDSLWRISRRVYGRGIRYSTIYLANQEQIKDPDMIWPGQIFAVPEKTEQGDTADMSKIGDQATSAPQ